MIMSQHISFLVILMAASSICASNVEKQLIISRMARDLLAAEIDDSICWVLQDFGVKTVVVDIAKIVAGSMATRCADKFIARHEAACQQKWEEIQQILDECFEHCDKPDKSNLEQIDKNAVKAFGTVNRLMALIKKSAAKQIHHIVLGAVRCAGIEYELDQVRDFAGNILYEQSRW